MIPVTFRKKGLSTRELSLGNRVIPTVAKMSVIELNHTIAEENASKLKLYKYLGNSLPVVETLGDAIRELRDIFESDSVNVELVHYVMRAYKSKPMEWKKYAKFDRYR